MKNKAVVLSLGAATVFVACVLLLERRVEVDVFSGRERSSLKLGPVVLGGAPRNTPFSDLLKGSIEDMPPSWRPVRTEGLFSSHCRFGYAASAIDKFVIAANLSNIDRGRKVVMAAELLSLLRDEQFEKADKLIDSIDL